MIEYTEIKRPETDERGIEVHDGGEYIGEITWYVPNPVIDDLVSVLPYEITYVFIYSTHRRRGIATELLRRAREIEPRIVHSPVRSYSGNEWAKSTGDPLPPSPWEADDYPMEI